MAIRTMSWPNVMIDFSVVVLTFNSQAYIEKCLNSLVDVFEEMVNTYEIFVIDNGSNDDSRKLIKNVRLTRNANIKLTEFDHNTGTTVSRNVGLKQAQGRYVIIMDSDAYANTDAVAGLRKYLDAHPRCGMAVPKLIYPDGRFQLSTDKFPTIQRKAQRFLFLKKIEKNDIELNRGVHKVDCAISAFWMFPKRVMDEVGLLDENIFYSPEDVDYCLRIWSEGYEIDYLPEFSIVHDAQEISRGFKVNWFTFLHIKGLFYYFIKHRYCFNLNRLYKRIGRSFG